MELEVGMYVRTKHNGIGKIVEYINDATHYFFKCYKLDRDCSNCEEYITKADVIGEPSHNITDLIEVGDYVNDEKIVDIGCLTNGPERGTKIIDYYIAPNTVYYFKNEDIKSIVTKEQFEQMQYKVGE